MIQAIAYSLRPIQGEDDATMAAIIRTVMPEFGAIGSGFAIADPEVDWMSRAYAEPRHAYFVVESNGRVIGGCGIAPLIGLLGALCWIVQLGGEFGRTVTQTDPQVIALVWAVSGTTPIVGQVWPTTTRIAHGLLAKKAENLAEDMELLISGLLTKCYNQKGKRGSFEFPSEVQA